MKVKKIIKITLIIISIIIVLDVIFINVDYSRIKKYQKPMFAIYMGINETTKAEQYYGLGYTIIKCPYIANDGSNVYDNSYKLFLFSRSHICMLSYEKS